MVLSRKKQASIRPWEIKKKLQFMLPVEQIDPVLRAVRQRKGSVNIANSWQEDIQLTYVLAGKGVIEKNGRRYELSPGSLFFFMPYQRYGFICPDPNFEIVIALFDIAPSVPGIPIQQRFKERNKWAYDLKFPRGVSLPLHLALEPGGQVEALAKEMVQAYGHDNPLGRYRAKVLLQRMLLTAMDHEVREADGQQAGMTAAQWRIETTLTYILKHAAEPLSIPQLASQADLSVSHFIRMFKLWTGQTPADYIHYQRIENAKRLLSDGRLSVKQIARRVGYQDPFHFSRVFRRVEGLSPTAYRQSVIIRSETTAKSS